VLSLVGGNKLQAARTLGIDRRSLYRRLAALKIHNREDPVPDPPHRLATVSRRPAL
jgi:DNA-binding NtrC family response regulator